MLYLHSRLAAFVTFQGSLLPDRAGSLIQFHACRFAVIARQEHGRRYAFGIEDGFPIHVLFVLRLVGRFAANSSVNAPASRRQSQAYVRERNPKRVTQETRLLLPRLGPSPSDPPGYGR